VILVSFNFKETRGEKVAHVMWFGEPCIIFNTLLHLIKNYIYITIKVCYLFIYTKKKVKHPHVFLKWQMIQVSRDYWPDNLQNAMVTCLWTIWCRQVIHKWHFKSEMTILSYFLNCEGQYLKWTCFTAKTGLVIFWLNIHQVIQSIIALTCIPFILQQTTHIRHRKSIIALCDLFLKIHVFMFFL
jgi:hypothetical protein